MKTPVEELFELLWNTPKDKFTWYAIRKKMLDKEKEVMRNFGIRCIDGYYSGSSSEEDLIEMFFAKKFFQEDFTEFFDKTFNPTKEK